jgi:tRNA pseudouridine13 synthase
MYKLKSVPEDFVVKERSNVEFLENGNISYYEISKKQLASSRAIEMVAKHFDVKLNDVGYAGSKDKEAITFQKISVRKRIKKDLDTENLKLRFIGFGNDVLSLGDLEGNGFEIVLRNIDSEPSIKDWTVNYFDDQRFSFQNNIIGELIIKGDLKEAVAKLNMFELNEHLNKNKNDFVGALKLIPRRTLLFYLHSYQSLLWNKTVVKYLSKFKCKEMEYSRGKLLFPLEIIENKKIPMIGFDYDCEDEEIDDIITEIMSEEDLTPRSFIFKQLPKLSLEGGPRDLISVVEEVSFGSLEDDDLNAGKKKILVKFYLKKGSYATMFIKDLFSKFADD